uniref:Vitamin D-binding protein n=1 Tax=Propithecus coquereli TaxID=379532 RepID=A0A2K6F7Z2_PROCO
EVAGAAGTFPGRNMKRVLVFLLAAALGHALERGRDYEKDKVCKEITSLGKDDFTSLSLVLYSRKFPSGTFEQVSQLVKEVVSLTEACCAEGADPDCYDTRTSALSVKSCESDSPFPVHPGTAECCTKEGLERKLCMAALKHPPQEFPTYVEPTNDEICEAFRKDPKGFADQYTFELSRRTHIPEVFLSKVLEPTLKSLGECCDLEDPTACLKAKGPLLKKELSSFIGKGQELCADYSENTFTEYKKKLAERLRAKLPDATPAELDDLVDKRSDFASKCCSINSPPLYCDSQIDAEMTNALQ